MHSRLQCQHCLSCKSRGSSRHHHRDTLRRLRRATRTVKPVVALAMVEKISETTQMQHVHPTMVSQVFPHTRQDIRTAANSHCPTLPRVSSHTCHPPMLVWARALVPAPIRSSFLRPMMKRTWLLLPVPPLRLGLHSLEQFIRKHHCKHHCLLPCIHRKVPNIHWKKHCVASIRTFPK